MKIKISWSSGTITADITDGVFFERLKGILPLESRANTWGEEVYFKVPVRVPLEKEARDVVDPGTICYWVEGSSLAIPFGRTPASRGDECRLVTRVNILGKIEGDPKALKSVRDGDKVSLEAA